MGIVFIIGLGIVLLGVLLVVQGVQGQRRALSGTGGLLIVLGAVFAFLSTAFVVVPAGNVGVVFNIFGGVQQRVIGEGFHIVVPFMQQVTLYEVRQKELTLAAETGDEITGRSSEGLEITADVTILYQVARDNAATLHQDIGPDYERVRIRPVVRTQVRDALAEYRAADLISAQRAELQRRIESTLISELERDNLNVLRVLMRDVRIPVAITQAIEEKQAAEQLIEVEENRRRQSEVSAERAVVEAQGQRDAAILRAEGEAQALSLRGQAIRENPEIVQLEVAQRLAPSIQTIMLPSEGNFLLDVRGLTNPPAPVVQAPATVP